MLIEKKNALLLTLYLLGTLVVIGQSQKPVTGHFQKIYFKEFVAIIEASADYHFYYDTIPLDSLLVSVRRTFRRTT